MICNDCGELVVTEKVGRWSWCLCGNIGGKYVDNVKFQVAIKNKNSARVLGMENGVLHGLKDRGDLWKQTPGDPESGANLEEIDYNMARELYAFGGTGGSDTLILDMAKVVGILPTDGAPCFSETLFHLVFKADRENRIRLKKIYPIHVDMVDRYQMRDGVIAHPQHPEAGMFIPTGDGGFQWMTPEQVMEMTEKSKAMRKK